MSADAFVVYFGVRYAVESVEELDRLERRNDPRLEAARKARLKTFLGRATGVAPYFLLVGSEVGQFGVEGRMEADLTDEELRRITEDTRKKLTEAGFDGVPKLHLQVLAQY